MFQFQEDDKRRKALQEPGNMLIMGGPGSGKTTFALFKSKQLIESGLIQSGQKVLFLSFARSTISRVEEQAGNLVDSKIKKSIEINTYHGFIWNVLKKHGYLLSKKPLKLLPPHEASTRLAHVEKSQILTVANNWFEEEGLVHFDLFANICNRLLSSSQSLLKIICDIYPVIILDEFQDTNPDEWMLIRTLGAHSTLIALADPDQRIYDFRGADPQRIPNFIEEYKPAVFDFGTENNRSNGTDIVEFGNDLLAQVNKGKTYKDVEVRFYSTVNPSLKHIYLKSLLLSACKWIKKESPDKWSVAVLVPTNAYMLEISDFLQKEQQLGASKKLPIIHHDVAVDTAGPSLAASLVATLLEKGSCGTCEPKVVIEQCLSHILGRKGNSSPPQKDLTFVEALNKYLATGNVMGKTRLAFINECASIAADVNAMRFSGNVITDWNLIVSRLACSTNTYVIQVANDAKYIRLLQRGSQLYSALSLLWKETHSYSDAFDAVSFALTQEHFSMSTKTWDGVSVMTIHKSKGKEFDVVIIYEGKYQNRIVSKPDRIDQARLNLRVAVTRAKRCAVILTPEDDPCPLL